MSENSFIIFHAKENPTIPGNLDKRKLTKGAVKGMVSVFSLLVVDVIYTQVSEKFTTTSVLEN